MTDTDDQLARRLLRKVLDGDEPWTPDMPLRIATVSQAYASLAIVEELRRLNDDRSQWYREVLEVLTRAKVGDGSPVGSGQPEAASGCQVCGRADPDGVCPRYATLTRQQWRDHSEAWQRRIESMGATRLDAALWAERIAENWFGPCPEES